MGESSDKAGKQRLFQHRDLLIRFTIRAIERQTKGSWLGTLWVIVNPILMLGLFTFVFGAIMGGSFGVREDAGAFDYPLGIFIGLTVVGLMNETMGQSPSIFLAAQNLVKKVVFPLQILPVATVGSIFFKTLMSSLLAVLGILFVGPGLTWAALWFPLILFPMLLMAVGLSWLISSLGVYFRDSQQMMQFLGTALFYASAVFYSPHRIPDFIFTYLKWNPVLQAIELSRDVLLWDIALDPLKLLYVWLAGIAVMGFGYLTFKVLRPGFADVL